MEDRKILGERIEARVVAERPFPAPLAGLDVAFEHDMRARRHLEIDGDSLHELDAPPAEESGQQQLVEPFRHRRRCRVGEDRLGAQRHRHLEPLAHALGNAMMLRATLVPLPVHAGRASVEHLHPVRADVSHAGFRILGNHERQRDVAPAVFGPRLQNRQLVKRSIALDDFLTRRVLDGLRHQIAQTVEHREHLERVEHAGRHLRRHHLVDVFGHGVERRRAERETHPFDRAEQIGRNRHVEAGRPLEQQPWAAAGQLADTIGDRCDLQIGVDALADARQQAALVEVGDEIVDV